MKSSALAKPAHLVVIGLQPAEEVIHAADHDAEADVIGPYRMGSILMPAGSGVDLRVILDYDLPAKRDPVVAAKHAFGPKGGPPPICEERS